MAELSAAQIRAVEDAVKSVVEHDEDQLAVIAADAGDLCLWVREYGRHGTVDLVMPPGDATDWRLDVVDREDGSRHVIVDMWTRQEGRSDLSLEIDLREAATGEWQPRIVDLHVL